MAEWRGSAGTLASMLSANGRVFILVTFLASLVTVLAYFGIQPGHPTEGSHGPTQSPTFAGGGGSPSRSAQPGPSRGRESSGSWIAQLASVPVRDGQARLKFVLASVQRQVPGAAVLTSADYASLKSGYWVIFFPGPFSDGIAAISFCKNRGRTTADECIGRYLSHNPSDFGLQCLPDSTQPNSTCFKPQ